MKIQHSNGIEKENLIKEQTEYHEIAEFAYETEKRNKERMKIEKNILVVAFDLQQCLPTP